ncbi:MAG: iron-sulfur cluster assembly scaffold protein [Candidatus Aenigmatarchaeota archaeon]
MNFSLKYSKRVMEEFQNPKNIGEIKNPDGIGRVGSPLCGDIMWCYIKVAKKDNKEYIEDIKIRTFGCVANIATSSVLTESVKGKTLEDAQKIKPTDIIKALDGLPEAKKHCADLAINSLKAAIEDYKSKKSKGFESKHK